MGDGDITINLKNSRIILCLRVLGVNLIEYFGLSAFVMEKLY